MPDVDFLTTADRIGSRLCRDALWSGNRCNWVGWALEVLGTAWSTVYKAQSPYLYDGAAGISLFLARLYGFTNDPLQRTTAIGALNRSVGALPDTPKELRASAYSGAASIAYAAIEIGEALDEERMILRGMADLRNAVSAPDNRYVDILSGSAGAIQVLLNVSRRFDCPALVDLAIAHGELLLEAAAKSDAGWSWDTLPGQSEKHLLGYGHGTAGIACALLELWSETGELKYRQAALEAFRYERSHFSPEHHNWPDLRSMAAYGVPPAQTVYATAWCHGAPGIGLSRLRALELLGNDLLGNDDELGTDLDEAIRATTAACSQIVRPSGGSYCLCHGLAGNLDLLINAADSQGRSHLRHSAETLGRQAAEYIQSSELPWPCGVTGAGETPNLMLGLAGIGYFYLRLHDSVRVPSILLLRGGAVRTSATPESDSVGASA
jgi:lantibiotic biosynthesis protein